MQALITELNADSKLSNINLDLQNVQNLKQSQNSKSSVSFSDLLNTVHSEKTDFQQESVQKEKTVSSSETTKASENKVTDEKTVKSEEKQKTSDSDSVEEKTDGSKNEVKDLEKESAAEEKELKVEVKTENPEIKSGKKVQENTEQNQKIQNGKKESKTAKSDKKEKAAKLDADFDRLEDFIKKDITEKVPEESIAEISSANTKTSVVLEKSEADNDSVSELKLNLSDEKNGDLQDIADLSSEKQTYLDKDKKILVKDFRTQESDDEKSDKNKQDFKNEVHFDSDNSATITMDLNAATSESDVLSLNNQVASSDGSNFQSMLNNQIQVNIPDVVKAGSIILKDNDQGTINLVLHPDDIGNVKISLSMDGKTVSGHIIVQTKEAMAMFRENAQDLKNEFLKNGFDFASFDISYSDNSSGSSQNQGFENQYNGNEFIAKQLYGMDTGEAAVSFENLEKFEENFSNNFINIVA